MDNARVQARQSRCAEKRNKLNVEFDLDSCHSELRLAALEVVGVDGTAAFAYKQSKASSSSKPCYQ